MTATELRELLLIADEAARKAVAFTHSLLAPCYSAGRHPGRYKFNAAHQHLIRMVPSFGSIEFEEVLVTNDELRVVERRAGPACFNAEDWRLATGGGPPCVALGRLWLVAGPGGFQVGGAVQALFSLAAVDQWLDAHPGPEGDYSGNRVKAWPNHPIVPALANDPGWVSEDVEGVGMVSGWIE